MLLILSNKLDTTTDVVIKHLNKERVPFIRWNVEDMLQSHKITLEMNAGKIKRALLKAEGRKVDLEDDIEVIWYRRPDKVQAHPLIQQISHREFAVREGSMILSNLWALLENKTWVNHPSRNTIINNKLYQFKIADQLGIQTPPTLVTNNPSEVKRFKRKYGDIAAKPLSAGVIQDTRGEKLMYTRKLKDTDIARLESIKLCPTLFQAYVAKKIELRITVIENAVFACAIDSQRSTRTMEDWRRYDFQNVPHYPFKLPNHLKNQLINFLKVAGLKFGAFDFILTPENQYIFLEINPNGQWYWIEQLTGLKITDSLVKFFKNHA